jgi:dTDP-4-dehydrorhamnose reductase
MRVAVIGSSGQLGSDVVRVLSDSSFCEVTSVLHNRLDITNRKSVTRVITQGAFDVVVNCAAFTRVGDCEDFPNQALLVNAQGAFEIARACTETGSLCVFVSTDYVFSGDKGSSYLEQDPVGPLNVYGASKLAGEFLVRNAANRWLILRTSSLFGTTGSGGKGGNFIETIIAKALAGDPVRVVDDIRMSPSYTLDVAHAIKELIRSKTTGLYHVANSGYCSWYEFARDAIQMAGLAVNVERVSSAVYQTKVRRPKDSTLNISLLEVTLGYTVRPWTEALRAYLVEKGHLKS